MEAKIAIVVSRFNEKITKEMKEHAIEYAKKIGLDIKKVVEVPGAFEIPFAAQKLLENEEIEGVATLGAVIKGQTAHDEVIVYSVANKLLRLSLKYKKPVSLGIIGPNATLEQAIERKKEYAERSIKAVAELLK